MTRLLSRRESAGWALAFLFVSTLLVLTGFTSEDPDSALYASLSARLAEGPPSSWIAPEWWGYWNSEGLFREHPIGVLLLPTVLGWLGLPAVQAAYIVGIGSALACLLLIGHLTARVTAPDDGRLALVLLQVIPVAFIFRIRANHEYPMLLCLLLALVGLDGVRRSWRWLVVPPLALTAALLIKGVFVLLPMIAAGLWLIINPVRERGALWRPLLACGLSLVVMAGTAAAYDAAYLGVTGETFWGPYWNRQLSPLTLSGPGGGAGTWTAHLGFYVLRILWHPAPWVFALAAAAWRSRRAPARAWQSLSPGSRRGLAFAGLFAAVLILMLSPASRFAERYLFSATYGVAAAGAVVALYLWPAFRQWMEQLDRRVPALPVACWTALMLLRLTVGPYLPRIMG